MTRRTLKQKEALEQLETAEVQLHRRKGPPLPPKSINMFYTCAASSPPLHPLYDMPCRLRPTMGTAVMLLLTPFLVASGLPRMSASLLLRESPRPTPGAPQVGLDLRAGRT